MSAMIMRRRYINTKQHIPNPAVASINDPVTQSPKIRLASQGLLNCEKQIEIPKTRVPSETSQNLSHSSSV